MSIDSIYDQAKKDNMIVINGGEQSLNPVDDNVFQINPGNYDSEVALGKLIKEDGRKNVALITGNHKVFFRFAEGVKTGYGNEKINETIVNFGEKDVKTIALKIKTTNPDAIVMLLTPDLMARFAKTFKELGLNNVPYYFDADLQFGWDTAVKIVDPNIFNGQKVVTINNYTDPGFVDMYERKFGNRNTLTANTGYDAVSMLVKSYGEDESK